MRRIKHWTKTEKNGKPEFRLSHYVHPDWFAYVYPHPTTGKYIYSVGRRAKPGEAKEEPFVFDGHDGWKNASLAKMAAIEKVEAMEAADKAADTATLLSRVEGAGAKLEEMKQKLLIHNLKRSRN